MKLHNLVESVSIQYTSVYDEDGEIDYDLVEEAENLVNKCGLHMLRDDEVSDVAISGGKVVGVLYNSMSDYFIENISIFTTTFCPIHCIVGIFYQ